MDAKGITPSADVVGRVVLLLLLLRDIVAHSHACKAWLAQPFRRFLQTCTCYTGGSWCLRRSVECMQRPSEGDSSKRTSDGDVSASCGPRILLMRVSSRLILLRKFGSLKPGNNPPLAAEADVTCLSHPGNATLHLLPRWVPSRLKRISRFRTALFYTQGWLPRTINLSVLRCVHSATTTW